MKTTNFMQKKTEKRELLLGKMLNWMIYRKRDQESVVISLDSYLQDPIYKETFTTSFFSQLVSASLHEHFAQQD